MAWPNSVLPVLVEMWTGSEWVDITALVRTREGITVRRGFPDEGRSAEPGSISMTCDNRTGNLSPRNPKGTYYGLIGRNTPVRVTLGGYLAGGTYMQLQGPPPTDHSSLDGATTSDAAVNLSGDIDVRFDGALDGWDAGAALAGKYVGSGTARAWALLVDVSGNLTLGWSPDGTSGAVVNATSTVAAGLVSGERKALRATLDVNNGAGGWTVTFYTADTIDGSWVQLGDPVTGVGTTSIHSPDVSPLQVGRIIAFTALSRAGRVYGFELRDGIGGTAVADPDFTTLSLDSTLSVSEDFATFVDAAGRTWRVDAGLASDRAGKEARIVDPNVRAHGEVSEWPSRWDVSGNDVTVTTVAQGVLRRLGQGERASRSPVKSALLGDLRFSSDLVAGYWSLEDRGGTTFASAIGGLPMTYSGAAPEFWATGPFMGSDSVAKLGATTRLQAELPTGTDAFFGVGVLLDVPSSPGFADGTPILRVQMDPTSSMGFWEVRYKTGGGLQVATLDHTGVQLSASGTLAFAVEGESIWLHLDISYITPTSSWRVETVRLDADGEPDIDSDSSSFATGPLGHPVRVIVAPNGGLDQLGVGHVIIGSVLLAADPSLYPSGSSTGTGGLIVVAAKSFRGERAGWRARRLLSETEVQPRIVGVNEYAIYSDDYNTDDGTQTMGAQPTPTFDDAGRRTGGTFADNFAEVVAAEMALVYEARDSLGLVFRTRRSLYNQTPALTLDYVGAGEVAPPLEPTDDDQQVVNDVEVRRKAGSSARATDVGLPTGTRMGTAAPPDGVGSYETSVEVNIDDDDDLKHHAGWRLHLGTWDEQRYPKVTINLRALKAAGKDDLVAAALQLDVGDRLVIENLPAWLPPENADLVCLGFTETYGDDGFGLTIEVNCIPYGPWDVGVAADVAPYLNDKVKRLGGDRLAALREAIDTDDTSFDFDPLTTRWTTDADHFDSDQYEPFHVAVGGERMLPTAISTTAATYVAAGAASHADNAAVTPALYAGAAADDLMLCLARIRSTSAELSITTGWSLLEGFPIGGLYLWAKKHDGSESDPTVTPSGGVAGDTVSAVTLGFRNMPAQWSDTADFVVRSTFQSNTTAAQDIAYPRGRRPKTGGCVWLIVAGKSDDWTGVAPPSGFTEAVDASTTTGSDQGLVVYYRIDTTPDRVVPGSLTVTGGSTAVSESAVLAIAGGFQVMTVTRNVNTLPGGKSHSAGATIAIVRPLHLAL